MKFQFNFRLIPGVFLQMLAVPFMLGTLKYKEGSWLENIKADPQGYYKKRLESLLRHVNSVMIGEYHDEDGQLNFSAIMWNAAILGFIAVKYFSQPLVSERLATRFEIAQNPPTTKEEEII